MQYVLFTDNLADLSIETVCPAIRAHGFDGIDLTLRPGGHVLPEDAEMGLAKARQVADRLEVVIPMASTAIAIAAPIRHLPTMPCYRIPSTSASRCPF